MSHETIRLIFPPQFEPFQAYLSGPYLKSLLCLLGVSGSLFDANIHFYEWLVAHRNRHPTSGQTDGTVFALLRETVGEAIPVLKQAPSNLAQYRWAVNVTDEYLRAVAPPGVKIGLTHLKVGNRYSSADLLAYLSRAGNVFEAYFEHASSEILGSEGVSTYLLSLVVIDQLAAAVAFARQIKKRRPNARVIVGGPIVSRLHRQLSAVPWIAQTFDAIVPGEGYRVLPAVLGLSSTYSGHVSSDFSDLDLDRYWSCRRVLPYLVAHGCKWGRCAFCSHHLTYDGYRSSGMHEVLGDLERLAGQHATRYISFSDEYLTPAQLDDLSNGLLECGLDLRWSTFARPEPQFKDADFAVKLYAAGCRMLMFGLESASQRVINSMKKGTRVADFRAILEACKAANIAIRYDFMVGFPGETKEEVAETYDFIRQNQDVIDTPFSSYSVSIFELRSGIPVLEQAERFRILPRNALRGDLDDQYEFECESGLSAQARVEWREKLVRFSKLEMHAELICPQNKTHQLILKDLYDAGELRLPVLQARPERFAVTFASLTRGVELIRTANALRVLNHANGGELEVSFHLAKAFGAIASGATLDAAFGAQEIWNGVIFARLVNFLYRNDYIELRDATEVAAASPPILEVAYA